MDDKGTSFEDIIDAYLAYLQVSFTDEKQVYILFITLLLFLIFLFQG